MHEVRMHAQARRVQAQNQSLSAAPPVPDAIQKMWKPTNAMVTPSAMRFIWQVTSLSDAVMLPPFVLSKTTIRRVTLVKPPCGKLGLGLRKKRHGEPFCRVERFELVPSPTRDPITQEMRRVPGPAERSSVVQIQDLLLSVGCDCVGGMALPDVVSLIKNSGPTCSLGLCRPYAMGKRKVYSVTLQFHVLARSLGVHFVPVSIPGRVDSSGAPCDWLRCLMVTGIVAHPQLQDREARGTLPVASLRIMARACVCACG